MNRRDRLRIDERRRISNGSDRKTGQQPSSSSNHFGTDKHLMDSFIQSQQIIQSLSGKPAAPEADGSKSFRIPRKQTQPVVRDKRCDLSKNNNRSPQNRGNGRSSNRERGPRHRSRENSLRHSRDRSSHHPRDRRSPIFHDNRRPPVGHSPTRSFDSRRDRVDRSPEGISFRQLTDSYSQNPVSLRKQSIFMKGGSKSARRRRRNGGRGKPKKRKRYNKTKPIKAYIFDHGNPNEVISPEKVATLIKGLLVKLEKKILSSAVVVPKFLGYNQEEGLFVIMCANYVSGEFVKTYLEQMPPPWPGAALECVYNGYDEYFVKVVVPKPIFHFSEFIALCKESNNKFCIEKWRRVWSEEQADGLAKLFMFGMDSQSYEIIVDANNKLRCGDHELDVVLHSRRNRLGLEDGEEDAVDDEGDAEDPNDASS